MLQHTRDKFAINNINFLIKKGERIVFAWEYRIW